MMRSLVSCVLPLIFSVSMVAQAWAEQPPGEQITDLDQLLDTVRRQQNSRQALNAKREQEFLQQKQQRQALLEEARTAFERSQRHNQPLVKKTEANAREIARLEKQLDDQVHDMGDINATFREFAGDFSAVLRESPVTVQFPERIGKLQQLASAESQPTIADIQALWLLLQEEMTEAAKVVRMQAPVVAPDGASAMMQVVRMGTFSAYAGGQFLRYVPETAELLALSRQPASHYRKAAERFAEGRAEIATAVIDPTHGSLLGMMSYAPGLRERIEQGGPIAKIILLLGALGILITCWRSIDLGFISLRVRRQLRQIDKPNPSNPLGRVLLAANNATTDEEEQLLLILDEVVLAEVPALERGSGLVKLLAAIAPLLGLLGTVTGMIITFQAISLYGTGDPKLMADGISQALVTTVLGLVVAIPLLFGHSLVTSLSRSLVQQLDEQSAGVLARSVERREQ